MKKYFYNLIKGMILTVLTYSFISVQLCCQSVNIENVKADLKYLSDDKLEGREAGDKFNLTAAEYIAEQFKAAGLKQFGFGYLQIFLYPKAIKLGDKNDLFFNTVIPREGLPKEDWKKVKRSWAINTDWRPMSISDIGSVKDAELVFVGFGVSSKDLSYDDYAGIDVKGKVVIVIGDSTANGGTKYNFLDEYSNIRYKVMNAREHGASAVIIVKRQSDSANTYYKEYIDRFASKSGIMVIQANRTSISKFFPAGKNLYPMETLISNKKQPVSFVLPNLSISLNIDLQTDNVQIPNVVGYIEGTDKSKSQEYIVIGGHFDHLGWGDDNSTYKGKTKMVHNGADDNASGTSAVIELSRIFSKNPTKRPIIFVAFNAEEKGLLGSSYFVKNSPVPINQIVSMLNFDMVGRMKDNSLSMLGTGSSMYFSRVIDSIAAIDSLNISKMQEGFSPSDNSSFFAESIPVLMFFSGLHSDYHSPADDYDKINFEGMNRIINFAEKIVYTIGNENNKPDINKSINTDPKKDMKPSYGNVWFGIVPDFGEDPNGLKISGTSESSPAQKAGLQNADIITEFAGKKVKNLYDLTYCLKEAKAGDKVIVKYLRAGKEKSVEVELKKK